MDDSKKAAFVKAMGKKRAKFSKGGLIRKLAGRKYFAEGGDTTLAGAGAGGVQNNETNPSAGLIGTFNEALGINNNFQASGANILQGTNAPQLNAAYTGVQGALTNQGNLVNTLTPQAADAVSNQNALAQQLYGMTQGTGPNPAQKQLAQQTAANVAQTGAQMAGARGAGGNIGMMARQIGQQGANTQQQAAGQEATLEAQQQIAAQQNLANLANNQISQSGQSITGLNSAQQNEQAILQNANTSANNAAVGMQSNINNVNSQTSAANQNMAANTVGGMLSAMSSMGGMMGAKGGVVDSKNRDHHIMLAEMNAHSLHAAKRKNFDDGGEVDAPDLGSFKAGDGDADSPSVPGTSSLPADQTDFGKSFQKSGGGGGGGGGMGGMMSGMTSMIGMMSDEEHKKNKQPAAMDQLLDNLQPTSYDYDNPQEPGAAAGRQYGVMAQDLEKSKAGASIVHDTPAGKMVDPVHGLGVALAALGELNERIKHLEGKKMADGGMINPNPLLTQNHINGPGTWGSGSFNSGSASSPNIAATSSLPSNHTKFSDEMKKKKEEKPKETKPKETIGETKDWDVGGGLAGSPGDDQMTKDGGVESPGSETADSEPVTMMAAKGGMAGRNHFHEYFSEGGKVPAMLSPGEIYLSPESVHKVIHEGKDPMKVGEMIPGKASKKNDSLKNDTVPMTLEEGGVVIPRHITTHKMSSEKAELFVHRALARKKARGK